MKPVHRSAAATLAALAALAVPTLAAAQGTGPVADQVDTALRGVLLVGAVVLVLILAAVAVLVYRKLLTKVPESGPAPAPAPVHAAPPAPANPLAEAEREEARGNLVAAAQRYEAAGEQIRAGECWEKVKDFARAAECFEAGEALERAAQLHLRAGGSLRAAGIYMRTKNFVEAAKIFRNKGDHLRAAQALELYGNRVAAARSYAEAGNHARAARLLEEEGMYGEAAEAYHPLLGGIDITPANADRWATYASLLVLAGEREKAEMTYRRVLVAVPDHLRAESGLRSILPRAEAEAETIPPRSRGTAQVDITPEEPMEEEAPEPPAPPSPEELAREIEGDIDGGAAPGEDPLRRVFTLRSMITAGRMEPRYGMRLWVQIMRVLSEHHRANRVFGCLAPESILVDMENNVRIEEGGGCPPEYLAPEVQAGIPADRQADIYAMGVILFELVAGSTAELGRRRPSEIFADNPPWLDDLVAHCTEKNLTRRFATTEEVSQALLRLKSAPQD